jgi:hypothetical protein
MKETGQPNQTEAVYRLLRILGNIAHPQLGAGSHFDLQYRSEQIESRCSLLSGIIIN